MTKSRKRKNADVIIIGGGVMGCACAWELEKRGFEVMVLERSVPGAEASSAAAGIVAAQAEAHGPGPMAKLSVLSRSRFERWASALYSATGIDVEFRTGGLMRVGTDAAAVKELRRANAWQKKSGMDIALLDARAARKLEPALGKAVKGGVHFPGDARIDPALFLRALHVAAQRAGVQFRTGAYVQRVIVEKDRVEGVALEDGSVLSAPHVVVAAGSWTTLVEGVGLPAGAVRPARGQIVALASPAPLISRIVFGPRCYLVPRDDGRTLVGSTLEFVGYRREVTAAAVRNLLDAAIELVPELGTATVQGSWSNFRPYTDDQLPFLGPSGVEGLTLATGHYRTGILLAPITAEIVTSVVSGKRPPLPLGPFSPKRAS